MFDRVRELLRDFARPAVRRELELRPTPLRAEVRLPYVFRVEFERVVLLRAAPERAALKFVTVKLLVIQLHAPKPKFFHFLLHCFSSVTILPASPLRNCFSPDVLATLNRRLQRLKNDCFRLMSV